MSATTQTLGYSEADRAGAMADMRAWQQARAAKAAAAPILQRSTDLINTDGSYNVTLIMKLAHAKARRELNATIAALSGKPQRRQPAITEWARLDAETVASLDPVTRVSIKGGAGFPTYAKLLSDALTDTWFRAREFHKRAAADVARRAAVMPAPMFLIAAE